MQNAAEQGQALAATMTAQNQEIQEKLAEVLSAAKVELPQVAPISLPAQRDRSRANSQLVGRLKTRGVMRGHMRGVIICITAVLACTLSACGTPSPTFVAAT